MNQHDELDAQLLPVEADSVSPDSAEETSPEQADEHQSFLKRRSRQARRVAEGRAGWTPAKLVAVGVAAVLGVAILGVVGAAGYRLLSAQFGAGKQLDSAAALIEEADVIVVEVDAVVRSDVTTGLAETALSAANRVPQAQWQLKDALEIIDTVKQTGGSRDRERAALMSTAAQARLDMMDQAPTILQLNAQASEALPLARDGWELVLVAAKTSDEAVAAYNRLTTSGVKKSSKLNKRAEKELISARAKFVEAEAAFPEVDFEAYLAYIDTRIELNKLSQESDAAWLKKDTVKANEIIARYNALDATGVAQAQALPASPELAIARAYEKAAQAATNAYYNARDAATAADEALR